MHPCLTPLRVSTRGIPPRLKTLLGLTASRALLDFHKLTFETVLGRPYNGTESGYLFNQPLDETTYGTTVQGSSVAGDPIEALVLYADPIDISSILPQNGVTMISSALVAGSLAGIWYTIFLMANDIMIFFCFKHLMLQLNTLYWHGQGCCKRPLPREGILPNNKPVSTIAILH